MFKVNGRGILYIKSRVARVSSGVSRGFSTKIEIEHFQQISEIIESNLTRNQYLFEFVLPLKNGLSFNINYELEDYHGKSQKDASSVTMAFGWKGDLKWSL